MQNPFIWILEKILGPRMTVKERIAHNKKLAGMGDMGGAPVTRDQIDALINRVGSMRAPVMACVPQIGEPSTRADESRLGGWPGWPGGEALPMGPNGLPMLFLCQINFAEMLPFDPFPNEGLMQVFVASDDMYGCAFPSQHRQGFAVIYHAETAQLLTIDPYGGGEDPEFSVFSGDLHRIGRPIAFELQDMVPPPAHFLINAEFEALWQQEKTADFDQFDRYCDSHHGPEMYLGGYPRFVQYDIRSPGRLADYDQVIMQFGAPKDMMWGDVGEACFLMRREDLRARAFETAIYNWDCS